MTHQPPITEFGVEPVPGLPKQLPQGDTILWQGGPQWWSFARRVFHVNKIAAWFLFLSAWRLVETVAAGQSPVAAIVPIIILLAIGGAAIGFFLFIAWATQRTTIYTLTRERLIMRVGLALPVTINIPYSLISGAEVMTWSDETGNVPLKLTGKDRAAYIMLWPHARPWRLGQPQPMLRCIPDAQKVAGILADALTAFRGNEDTADADTARRIPIRMDGRTGLANTAKGHEGNAPRGLAMPGPTAAE